MYLVNEKAPTIAGRGFQQPIVQMDLGGGHVRARGQFGFQSRQDRFLASAVSDSSFGQFGFDLVDAVDEVGRNQTGDGRFDASGGLPDGCGLGGGHVRNLPVHNPMVNGWWRGRQHKFRQPDIFRRPKYWMALPTSGPISLQMIRDEFGGPTPVSLGNYYRGGGLVPNSAANANVPTSGPISLSNFRGATAATALPPIEAYIVNTLTELQTATAAGNAPPSQEDVFNSWARFDGNNFYPPGTPPGGQAGSWEYVGGQIVSTVNSSGIIGFVSPDALEYYTHTATMSSSNSDNDLVGIIVANYVDVSGVPHSIVAQRTGGSGAIGGPAWGLSRFDGSTQTILVDMDATAPTNVGWSQMGNTRVEIARNGNSVTLRCSQTNSTTLDSSTSFTYELPPEFQGPRPYGYCALSQQGATFANIGLTGALDVNTIFDARTPTAPSTLAYENGAWVTKPGRSIYEELGYPREAYNPTTGKTFLISGPPSAYSVVQINPPVIQPATWFSPTLVATSGNQSEQSFYYYANNPNGDAQIELTPSTTLPPNSVLLQEWPQGTHPNLKGITIRGNIIPAGTYTLSLDLVDQYARTTRTFTIKVNNGPTGD